MEPGRRAVPHMFPIRGLSIAAGSSARPEEGRCPPMFTTWDAIVLIAESLLSLMLLVARS